MNIHDEEKLPGSTIWGSDVFIYILHSVDLLNALCDDYSSGDKDESDCEDRGAKEKEYMHTYMYILCLLYI